MARLYLFAEGQTEQTFAGTLLTPHLAYQEVYLQGPILTAIAKKKGTVHRGGVLKYMPLKNDILRFLAQEKARDVFFTTMIDLYALPHDFPGWADAEKLRHSPDKRIKALEQALAAEINDWRFIPYIQLHEYEAYLFSDPTCFSYVYPRREKAILALKTIAEQYVTPELINDDPSSAPSKRIIAELPDYEDGKAVIGPEVAEWIGLEVIRNKCPHFNDWLSRLEQLNTK